MEGKKYLSPEKNLKFEQENPPQREIAEEGADIKSLREYVAFSNSLRFLSENVSPEQTGNNSGYRSIRDQLVSRRAS